MYMGIGLALCGALTIGIVETTIKKLCMKNVHYLVSIIYGSYFGMPMSLAISVCLHLSGVKTAAAAQATTSAMLAWSTWWLEVAWSIVSGLFGLSAQVALNLALSYEDASNIAILKTTDLIFTFLFQFYLIGISKDLLGSLGAALIMLGTFLILIYKFADKRLNSSTKQRKKSAEAKVEAAAALADKCNKV